MVVQSARKFEYCTNCTTTVINHFPIPPMSCAPESAPLSPSICHVPRSMRTPRPLPHDAKRESKTIYKWFNDILPRCRVSAKVVGKRYLCLVKVDGSCELITAENAPPIIPTTKVMLVLDGELVSIAGQAINDMNLGNLIESHNGRIFIVGDVLVPPSSPAINSPVWERLKALEMLLWTGECKVCGSNQSPRMRSKVCTCEECNFGLRLKHPYFARAVVKRSISMLHASSVQFSRCIDLHSSTPRKTQISNSVTTSLYNGCLLDADRPREDAIDLTWHDQDGLYPLFERRKLQDDFCFQVKGMSFLVVYLELSKFIDFDVRKASPGSILAEGLIRMNVTNTGAGLVPHNFPIEFPGSMWSLFVSLSHHYNTPDVRRWSKAKVVQCFLDKQQSRWIFQQFRDDLVCSTSLHVDRVIARTTPNQILTSLLTHLRNVHDHKVRAMENIQLNPSHRLVDHVALDSTRADREMNSIRLEDLIWNNIQSCTISSIKSIFDKQHIARTLYKRRIDGVVKALFREMMRRSVFFQFHDFVKFFIYSLFDQAIVIDIGTGKLKMQHDWESMFTKVIGIEREERHFPAISQNKSDTPGNFYDERLWLRKSLVIIKGDVCDPKIGKIIENQLMDGLHSSEMNDSPPSLQRADCCFGMFSLQSVISSRENLDNFLTNLLPNLKDDGLLVAMLLDGDVALEYMGNNSSIRFQGPGVVLELRNDRNSWAGLTGKYTNRSYHEEHAQEVAPLGLNNQRSALNLAMAEYGFLVQSVLPLSEFSHLLPSHQSIYYDYVSDVSRAFTSLYKCVVWKRVSLSPLNQPAAGDIEELESSNDEKEAFIMEVLTQSKVNSVCEKSWRNFHDYLDIRSHFQLAMTCKSLLRFYLRGYSHSLLSPLTIRKGVHIADLVKSRNNPLFKINIIPSVGINNNVPTMDYAVFNSLHSFPCVDRCCKCGRAVCFNQNGANYELGNEDCHGEQRATSTTNTNAESILYPEKQGRSICFCNKCSVGETNVSLLKGNDENLGCIATLLQPLILRTLFTDGTDISKCRNDGTYTAVAQVEEIPLNYGLNQRQSLDRLIVELIPEMFADPNFSISSAFVDYFDDVRELLNDSFFHCWKLFEYSLAMEMIHTGPQCNSSQESCGSAWSLRGNVIPQESAFSTALSQTQQLIGRFETWHERWTALHGKDR